MDELVRVRYGVNPVDDRSGLAGPTVESGEPDEEARFQAYMRRYFPAGSG